MRKPRTTRRSLSKEEHAIRLRFDAAKDAGDDDLRARLWRALTQARARGARQRGRLLVRVRLQENPRAMAAALIADLRIVSLPPLGDRPAPSRVEAYIACELLFGPHTRPCSRPGPCPHDVVLNVLESDNADLPGERQGYEALLGMAALRPRQRTP